MDYLNRLRNKAEKELQDSESVASNYLTGHMISSVDSDIISFLSALIRTPLVRNNAREGMRDVLRWGLELPVGSRCRS